ncbi:hypothetical protein DPMN_035547 [Dreissena polymorpha]|uniref:Uncharacterized protein n=1 Tax=Dreissena polymorpha TaxID=45954 RepID=A0A9D4M7H4_DREPO|nr:hypothetical protein DPMN_035547 [Dreissena polymorpha]
MTKKLQTLLSGGKIILNVKQLEKIHTKSLYKDQHSVSRKHCFTLRAAKVWNSLPDRVASAKTINSFKIRLDNHWKNQDMLYNYKAAINCNTGSHISRDLEGYNEDSEPAKRLDLCWKISISIH